MPVLPETVSKILRVPGIRPSKQTIYVSRYEPREPIRVVMDRWEWLDLLAAERTALGG